MVAEDVLLTRRLAYRALASERVARGAELTLGVVERVAGRRFAGAAVDRFASRVVWSGWPHYVQGWTKLHASQLYRTLRRRVGRSGSRVVPKRAVTARTGVWRVGCVGAFRGLLGFQPEFFERRPNHVELYVYDLQYHGQFATYLEPLNLQYRRVRDENSEGEEEWSDRLAERVNADQLDVVLNINPKAVSYLVVDRLTVPCIVQVCTGSELMYHEKVDFQIYAQPEAGYRQDGARLVCDVTNRPVGAHRVMSGSMIYDARGLERETVAPWNARRPLIVCHGSLYKLHSPPFLRVLARLLQDDSSVEMIYAGRDRSQVQHRIEAHFAREGVAGRVHYEGAFDPTRDEQGRVSDPCWSRLVSHLRAARLAPNPWPIGGGSARVEAYLLGVPAVHMKLGRAADRPHERSLIDLPALSVPSGTAGSEAEYLALCRRCLYDEPFATRLMHEQRAVGCGITDPVRYWQQVEHHYCLWRSESRDSVLASDERQ